jgi:hypothetical protein
MVTRHFRALVVGDVTLHRLPAHAKSFFVVLQERSNPLRALLKVLDCLLFPLSLLRFLRLIVFLAMAFNQLLDRLLDPLRLLL